MNTKLGLWIESRAELFRYIAELPLYKKDADKVLLSGDVSVYLAGLMKRLYSSADIIAVTADSNAGAEAKLECASLMEIDDVFDKFLEADTFDAVLSALQIQSLNTRELTPYLFNLYDLLKTGGVLYLSFPEAAAHTVIEKNKFPAWYNEQMEVYMKYYMADDVVRSLNLIGFDIKMIERDAIEELYSVVTVIGLKR